MPEALTHLRVVELCGDIPAASCARQFAAWGADVLVLEPLTGSPLRRQPPIIADRAGNPASLLWEYLGANKRSATLDLDDPSSHDDLRTLIQQADVFVTDRPANWLTNAGLDYASLSGGAPGLVMIEVTPFGGDGPYAGYAASDLVVQALSGMLSLSGGPNRMPLKVAANILPHGCGVSALVGALAALHERETSGRGQRIEVATVEAAASLVLFLRAQYIGEPFPRRSGVGTVLLPCRDGRVLCSPRALNAWDDLLVALGIEPDAVPEPLRTVDGRQDTPALLTFLEDHSRDHSAKELFHTLGALMVAGYLETPAQLLEDEHLRARGYFRTLDHPHLGYLSFPGPAGQMSETTVAPPRPALGRGGTRESEAALTPRTPLPPAREKESLQSASSARTPFSRVGGRGAASRGEGEADPPRPPLADIRVLDLTTAWIGPYAGMLLADLGADVIKVEGPDRPDTWRFFHAPVGPAFPQPPIARPGSHPGNTRFYYNAVNRNKRGLALDLADEQGKALFLELVRSADIVLENFTPRVLDNFGLGLEALRAVNPGIILVSFSGYGRTGPYRDIKATGATIETIGGWVSLFGYPDEPPMLMGEMEADPLSGLQVAALGLVALAHRDRTGLGQRIDGSMFEAAVGYIGEEILLAAVGADVPHPRGNRDRAMAPQGVFPCCDERTVVSDSADDLGGARRLSDIVHPSDQWLAITVRDDRDWRALLEVATDAPWLRASRFQTAAGRLARAGELEMLIARWTMHHGARELMVALQGAGVPAGMVHKTDEVPRDRHFIERGWFRPLTHPDTGTQLHNGYPWRFSRSPLIWRAASPQLGEHSAEILASELHLNEIEIATLFERGVVRHVTQLIEDEMAAPG